MIPDSDLIILVIRGYYSVQPVGTSITPGPLRPAGTGLSWAWLVVPERGAERGTTLAPLLEYHRFFL
jgi:hypothetical protein